MHTTLNKIEKNFRLYADSYLAIDTIVYRTRKGKEYLTISRRCEVFSPVEIVYIERLMELYKSDMNRYEIQGNKIRIFI